MSVSFQSKVQTRCSGETGGLTRLELAFFISVCSHSFSTDFIYSGFRVQFLSSVQLLIFTVWSPLRSGQNVKFFLLWMEVVLCLSLVCRDRVRKSVVFVTVNSIDSVYSLLLCTWVCIVCSLPCQFFVTCTVNFKL